MTAASVAAAIALALAATPASAARPGGGQNFSGGHTSGGSRSSGGSSSTSGGGSRSSSGSSRSSGGSSGGSSGFGFGGGSRTSSGSSGSSTYGGGSTTTPRSGGGAGFAFFFFVLLFIVAIAAVVFLSNGNTRRTRDAILDAEHRAAPPARPVSLDLLRARDPGLTEASIVGRVAQMSSILRDAWCGGDMRPARPFVSDGVYSRFQVQLALMRAEGIRNVMSDASILHTTLEGVASSPPLDAVHVRFTAQARDRDVPLAATAHDVARALRAAPIEPYTEIWTLVRRHGATSKLEPGDVGKRCPSCGAPFEDGAEVVTCRYCNALVCSAEHDWVLSEITQASEWRPDAYGEVRGLAEIRDDDPGTAREALEDRASYVFWKWVEAARTQSPLPLRKCATAAFVATLFGPETQALSRARNVVVGAADALLGDPGPDGDVDHVYVKITWSAGFIPDAPPTPMQNVVRLARKAGVTSRLSMTAVVCFTCGAKLTESDSTRCDHCGNELASGDQAWVLDAVLPRGEVRPREREGRAPEPPSWMVPDIADPRERALLFAEMAAVMSQDGVLGRSEKRLLRACARRWNISDDAVISAFANPAGGLALPIASSSPEWFLAGLVAAAMVDGTVDSLERAMLERIAARLLVPSAEIDRLIAAFQARLASEAAAS